MLIPWSAFWERNYFVEWSSVLAGLLTSNYTRGAITGLGLINVWSALAELGDLFGSRDQQSGIGNQESGIGTQESEIGNQE